MDIVLIFLCPDICAVCLPVKYVLESSFSYLTYEVLETDFKDFTHNILILVIIPITYVKFLPHKLTHQYIYICTQEQISKNVASWGSFYLSLSTTNFNLHHKTAVFHILTQVTL